MFQCRFLCFYFRIVMFNQIQFLASLLLSGCHLFYQDSVWACFPPFLVPFFPFSLPLSFFSPYWHAGDSQWISSMPWFQLSAYLTVTVPVPSWFSHLLYRPSPSSLASSSSAISDLCQVCNAKRQPWPQGEESSWQSGCHSLQWCSLGE